MPRAKKAAPKKAAKPKLQEEEKKEAIAPLDLRFSREDLAKLEAKVNELVERINGSK